MSKKIPHDMIAGLVDALGLQPAETPGAGVAARSLGAWVGRLSGAGFSIQAATNGYALGVSMPTEVSMQFMIVSGDYDWLMSQADLMDYALGLASGSADHERMIRDFAPVVFMAEWFLGRSRVVDDSLPARIDAAARAVDARFRRHMIKENALAVALLASVGERILDVVSRYVSAQELSTMRNFARSEFTIYH